MTINDRRLFADRSGFCCKKYRYTKKLVRIHMRAAECTFVDKHEGFILVSFTGGRLRHPYSSDDIL